MLVEGTSGSQLAVTLGRKTEQQASASFDQRRVGIVETGLDGRVLRVNRRLCEILDRRGAELLTCTLQDLTWPEDVARSLQYLEMLQSGASDSYAIEKRYVRGHDRVPVWCQVTATLVRHADGRPNYILSLIEDVSERKRATDVLRTVLEDATSIGAPFFHTLVHAVARALDVPWAFVAEVSDDAHGGAKMLAFWDRGRSAECRTVELKGSPWQEAVVTGRCAHPSGLQDQFSTDPFVKELGVEGCYGLSLVGHDGRCLGLLGVMTNTRLVLPKESEHLLVLLAARAAVELERSQVLAALRASEQTLQQLLHEREQLAQDLHDGLIQSIYAAALGLEEVRRLMREESPRAVEQLGMVIADLNRILEDVRNHIVGRAHELKNGRQLKTELERMARVFGASPTMRVVAILDEKAADLLTPAEANHVFYIAREALSNALRHSQGRHALVMLRQLRGSVRLEVSDNGSGFDLAGVGTGGHGLGNLAQRAADMKSRLHVFSSPGRGTRVVVDIEKAGLSEQRQD